MVTLATSPGKMLGAELLLSDNKISAKSFSFSTGAGTPIVGGFIGGATGNEELGGKTKLDVVVLVAVMGGKVDGTDGKEPAIFCRLNQGCSSAIAALSAVSALLIPCSTRLLSTATMMLESE